jgi:hypothetical protein
MEHAMRTALLSTLALAAYALAAQVAQADVYRYTDERGNVFYTDKPRTLPAERVDVKTQKTDLVSAERQAAELQRMQEADRARREAAATKAEQKAAAELTAKDKAERCLKARERYENYMSSPRLYETLPNNERRYLSDAEIDAARNSARATMEALCN